MGNAQTVGCLEPAGGKSQYLNKYLTPQQIQLVQASWDIMKEDLSTLGVTVFLSAPSLLAIFCLLGYLSWNQSIST